MADKPATIGATTAEGAALEVLMYLQSLERDTAKNPQGRNFVTGTYNSDTGIYSGTFSFPCTLALNPDGSIKLSADEYLQD